MSLPYAILVSLHNRRQSGYQIARDFDRGVGYFWQATHQQIYRELGKLGERGAVRFETVPQDGKPAKKVYEITKKGRHELRQWLEKPAQLAKIKDELLLRIYAGPLIEVEVLATEVRRHRGLCLARLEEYLAIEETYFASPETLSRAHRFIYLTLRKGILVTTATLSWFDEIEAFLAA